MPAWLVPAIFGAASAAGSIFSARQAQKFSERMSSTAHQREVADLRRAGLNPMLSARGSGASAPQGEQADVAGAAERGVSSALAARQARAQIELLEAQGEESRDRALLTRTQSADLQQSWNAGKWDVIRQQVVSGALDIRQKREMLPMVLERAKEEIGMTVASARQARARAALEELAREGAMNQAEFEKRIGEAGPWVKLLFELMRRIRQ